MSAIGRAIRLKQKWGNTKNRKRDKEENKNKKGNALQKWWYWSKTKKCLNLNKKIYAVIAELDAEEMRKQGDFTRFSALQQSAGGRNTRTSSAPDVPLSAARVRQIANTESRDPSFGKSVSWHARHTTVGTLGAPHKRSVIIDAITRYTG